MDLDLREEKREEGVGSWDQHVRIRKEIWKDMGWGCGGRENCFYV